MRTGMTQAGGDWTDLVGSMVELRAKGRYLRRGIVEAVSNDKTMMWLAPDGVDGRQLIMKRDPYELHIVEQQPTDPT